MILEFREAFEILEIEPTDDKKKIKIAYSKMLKKYHPEDFPEMFMRINEAYRIALEFEKSDFDEVKSENETTEKNNENTEFFERVKKNFEENKEKSFFGNFEDIFSDEKNGKYVLALPYDGFKISYTIDFNHTFLKSEYFEFEVNLENYMENIAKCRTFAFDYEIDFLKKNNLALGGSLENAIVVGRDGPLNPEGISYPDEFVRHKILDIIGDLYVLGRPIKAHVIAIKAGHFVNAKLTALIAEKYLK